VFRFDHVVLAVRDLEASASGLWDEYGLRFRPGGAHPHWGTANMIAPLGESYLELLAVVDPAVGPNTILGRSLLDRSAGGDRWWSVCLGDDDLETTAARLGLDVQPGSRLRPDGVEVRWRGAGIDQRGDDLWLPFFISWDVPPELHPGAAEADHGVDVRGISRVEVGGDEEWLRAWLGGAHIPIRVVDAEPGVHTVALALADGELVL
jgi:catechol 2,3-dioxygenase-like lactoylglutathione lyase family enzyme